MKLASFFTVLCACAVPAVGAALSACASSDPEAAAAPTAAADAGTTTNDSATPGADGGTPSATACPRKAAPADRVRTIVVSHPADASGKKSTDYEVLHLGTDGKILRDGTHFTMGRTFDAPILFSPDGEIGVAVQDDDGSLGVFRVGPSGAVAVVAPTFGKEHFYAGAATFSADGSRLYVVDENRKTTGGLHEVEIACDGTPTYKGRILESPGASTVRLVPGGTRALITAASAPGAPAGHDLFLVDLANGASLAGSVALFGDGDAIASGLDLTPDGKLGIVSDGNEFIGTHRVGVFSLGSAGLKKESIIDVEGPSGVVVSPYGNTALVTNAGGSSIDGFRVLALSASGATDSGKLTSLAGAKPQLPTAPTVIMTGTLKGLILVAEVEGIRRLRFEPNGGVTDLGVFTLEGGLAASVGTLGVQP